jgi:hypothetical protein
MFNYQVASRFTDLVLLVCSTMAMRCNSAYQMDSIVCCGPLRCCLVDLSTLPLHVGLAHGPGEKKAVCADLIWTRKTR